MGFGVEEKQYISHQCFSAMLLVPHHVDKHVCLLSISVSGALATKVTMLPMVFACLENVSGAFLATTISLRCFSEVDVF